jgi:hypothetical protein
VFSCIQMLLPASASTGDTAAQLNRTQRELIGRLGGVTAYLQTPARGQWADETGATAVDRVFLRSLGDASAADISRP